ncbi:MAG: NAD(+) diphosphatase [Fibrobacter sp.]|jgi:NAD+ diphosphatase|nr:NAD(+) diphosphatase [Fibrobacter sp.]
MIHEISPHRFNNHYLPGRKIGEEDFILHYEGSSVLLKSIDENLELPRKKDFPEISDKTETVFLFTFDDIPCFLVWDHLQTDSPSLIYKELIFFRTTRQQEIAWITLAGFHLMNWYSQNRFCGKCGARTQLKSDERAVICPECSTVVYPRISPAVIVAIICNDKILLARGSKSPGNRYSLIAGYVDVGETLEEAVAREVKEEVGLDVKNIRYYKNQPWPLSGSMMIGFIAEADDTQPVLIDEEEISEAAWFTRGNLPEHSFTISIAGEMIDRFDRMQL